MGKYLGQRPCPSCGSRDNLGTWSDGVFCFGCGYRKKERNIDEFEPKKSMAGNAFVFHNGGEHPSEQCIEWLQQYGLDWADVRHVCGWSDFRKQLVFRFRGEDGKVVCTVARNFSPERAEKAKYYTVGEKEEVCEIFKQQDRSPSTKLVITEDALSAIKVSKVCDAAPALGTSMSVRRLTRYFNFGYREFFVWLDRDKWKEAMLIADTVKWMGASAKCIYTELDPKAYSLSDILEKVK